MPHANKPEPVTLARLEVYLDWLAGVMVDHAPEFDSLLPIYERLENEIEIRTRSLDKMSLIRQRAIQSRSRSADLTKVE